MNVRIPASGFKRLLESLNCDGARGAWLLALCALLLLPELAGDTGRELLRYEREALRGGEWWRFLTAHFVHLDAEHAALNALGLVLLWALFARDFSPFRWLAIAAAAVVAIGAGLWLRSTTVEWYVGSSGVLHGILAAGTVAHVRRRELDGWLLAAILVAKLAWEQWAGAVTLLDSETPVVVDAHLYGALGGLAAALCLNSRSEPL